MHFITLFRFLFSALHFAHMVVYHITKNTNIRCCVHYTYCTMHTDKSIKRKRDETHMCPCVQYSFFVKFLKIKNEENKYTQNSVALNWQESTTDNSNSKRKILKNTNKKIKFLFWAPTHREIPETNRSEVSARSDHKKLIKTWMKPDKNSSSNIVSVVHKKPNVNKFQSLNSKRVFALFVWCIPT